LNCDLLSVVIMPISVLLADDSEPIRRAICTLLNSEPTITVVAEASDYAELLSKIRETNVDVILMDVHMPNAEQSNAEFIKGQLRGACLLAISFANDEETILLAESYGALRLLDKTELGSTLVPAIKECIQ
jgi:DNA-binding NarL/FixJ family response regulator